MEPTVATSYKSFIEAAREIQVVPGASPETSLYAVFQQMLEEFAAGLAPAGPFQFVPQAGAKSIGIPDFRVTRSHELVGWIELKAPKKNLNALTGHDADQRDRFVDGLRNLVLTNGWQWKLYQDGVLVADVVIGSHNNVDLNALKPAVSYAEIATLSDLLDAFFTATFSPYLTASAAVSSLAVRARALRSALIKVGEEDAGTMLMGLKKDFSDLVFRNGQKYEWSQFVDSYVQIATFGALLWRLEAKSDISLDLQVGLKHGVHPLLYQCLQILWSSHSRPDALRPLLEALCQTINLIPVELFEGNDASKSDSVAADPIVHAYEPLFFCIRFKG